MARERFDIHDRLRSSKGGPRRTRAGKTTPSKFESTPSCASGVLLHSEARLDRLGALAHVPETTTHGNAAGHVDEAAEHYDLFYPDHGRDTG